MNLKKHLLLTLIALGAAGTASAQSASNWTGFYLGANAGYGFGKSDVTTSTVFSNTGYFANSSVTSINDKGVGSVSPKGFTGGITFGYNFQNGSMVYGFEMDANTFNLKDDRSLTVVYPGFAPTAYTINQTTKTDYLVTLRGRIGFAYAGNLWYGTAGLAMTSIKIDDSFSDTFATAAESVSSSKSKTGWTVGGGYELSLQNNWSIKGELLYVDFGKVTVDGGVLTSNTPAFPWPTSKFTHSATLKGEVLRFGVNYRF
jgi:outer membrane immunogenic protein